MINQTVGYGTSIYSNTHLQRFNAKRRKRLWFRTSLKLQRGSGQGHLRILDGECRADWEKEEKNNKRKRKRGKRLNPSKIRTTVATLVLTAWCIHVGEHNSIKINYQSPVSSILILLSMIMNFFLFLNLIFKFFAFPSLDGQLGFPDLQKNEKCGYGG